MSEHPNADQLALFVSGQLPAASSHALASHLDVCSRCALEAVISRKLIDLDEAGLLPEAAPEARTTAAASIRRLATPKQSTDPDHGRAGGDPLFGLFGLIGGAMGLGAALRPSSAFPLTSPLLATSTDAGHQDVASLDSHNPGTCGHSGERADHESDLHAVRTEGGHASEEQDENFPGLAELEAMFAEALSEGVETASDGLGHDQPPADELQHTWDVGHFHSDDAGGAGFDVPGEHVDWFPEADAHEDPAHNVPPDLTTHDDDHTDSL